MNGVAGAPGLASPAGAWGAEGLPGELGAAGAVAGACGAGSLLAIDGDERESAKTAPAPAASRPANAMTIGRVLGVECLGIERGSVPAPAAPLCTLGA